MPEPVVDKPENSENPNPDLPLPEEPVPDPNADNTDDLLVPGEGDEEQEDRGLSNKWHDFESQYSLAVEQSAVIEREQWGGQCEFLMSCIASAVGLGNIWRFPLVAGQNGGGAFLFPYLIVLTIIGRPLYMIELGLGQFCSNGPIKIWEMAPGFRGVGVTAFIASFLLASFYCVILAWALLYLYYSMYKVFYWDRDEDITLSGITFNPNKSSGAFFGHLHLGVPQKEHDDTDFKTEKGLDGAPVRNLVIGLFTAWFLVWLVMVRGVSGSGKIAYFTALFPYVVLLILLIAGATLDGAGEGVKFFFYPDFEKMIKPQTWFQAVGQCFFSLGISFGGCIMFSSFNSFRHKLGRDILIISIMDTFTSILAGTCLFTLIGNIAYKQGGDSYELIQERIVNLTKNPGAGLAFVTFPNVLDSFTEFDGLPNFIAALFFFMIVVLAVGSANGLVGTTVTITCDYFPKWKRPLVVTGMCCVTFLCGLVYICPTGNYVIDIVDRHGSELVVYVVGIFEVVGVVAVYGLKNLSNDFEFMLGARVSLYWIICWAILPFLLCIIFVSYLVKYEKDDKWPGLAVGMAWTLTIICWSTIPGVAIFVIQTRKSHSFMKRFKASFLPTRKWGPKDPAVREAWRRWKQTKPREFAITGKILVLLRCRSAEPVENEALWSNDLQSQYQTTANSKVPSGTNMNAGVDVASDNPEPVVAEAPDAEVAADNPEQKL